MSQQKDNSRKNQDDLTIWDFVVAIKNWWWLSLIIFFCFFSFGVYKFFHLPKVQYSHTFSQSYQLAHYQNNAGVDLPLQSIDLVVARIQGVFWPQAIKRFNESHHEKLSAGNIKVTKLSPSIISVQVEKTDFDRNQLHDAYKQVFLNLEALIQSYQDRSLSTRNNLLTSEVSSIESRVKLMSEIEKKVLKAEDNKNNSMTMINRLLSEDQTIQLLDKMGAIKSQINSLENAIALGVLQSESHRVGVEKINPILLWSVVGLIFSLLLAMIAEIFHNSYLSFKLRDQGLGA